MSGRGWITPVVLRASEIRKVRGGFAACLRAFLEVVLLSTRGFATAGCPMSISGGYHTVFAGVSNLLSDGDGLRCALRFAVLDAFSVGRMAAFLRCLIPTTD